MCPIHSPWKEQLPEDSTEWEPAEDDSYMGEGGGRKAGPSRHMRLVAAEGVFLACIFLAIVPWSFFCYVATRTQAYA